MSIGREVVIALMATAELCGAPPLSDAARTLMEGDLAQYPETSVLQALARCRRELRGRLTLADIIERIDDGRPGPEQAWALVSGATEDATIVATEEMWAAFAAVNARLEPGEPSLLERDKVAARMAFVEAYRQIIATNRAQGVQLEWRVSLGHDKAGRLPALREAVAKGQIEAKHAAQYLPAYEAQTLTMTPMDASRHLAAGERNAANVVRAALPAKDERLTPDEMAQRFADLAEQIKPPRVKSESIDWRAEEERLARAHDHLP